MKDNLSWKYRRWFVFVTLTDIILLGIMAGVMINIPIVGNWVKASSLHLCFYVILMMYKS